MKAVAFYGSVIMGLSGMYFSGRKLFHNKLGLMIDEHGIYDNSGGLSLGFIPWSDISQIDERSVQASITSKQHFVTIRLVYPDAYIEGKRMF